MKLWRLDSANYVNGGDGRLYAPQSRALGYARGVDSIDAIYSTWCGHMLVMTKNDYFITQDINTNSIAHLANGFRLCGCYPRG